MKIIQAVNGSQKNTARSSSKRGILAKAGMLGLIAGSMFAGFASTSLAEVPPPLNGASPRPFYVFGHNPNTIPDVLAALEGGANALEPDITETDCGGIKRLVNFDSDPPAVPACDEPTLISWCDGVNKIAKTNKNLALVVFDIKPPAKDPRN